MLERRAAGGPVDGMGGWRVGKAIATNEPPSPPIDAPIFPLDNVYIFVERVLCTYIYTYIHCNIYTHCQILRPHQTAARVPFFTAIHPRRPANRSAPTHFCPVPRKWKATRDSPLKRYRVATETTPPTIATATATVTATAAAAATTTTTTAAAAVVAKTAACPSVSLYYIAVI